MTGRAGLLPPLIVLAAFFLPQPEISRPKADPVVRINVGTGHGSGTYLGNGFVLTALHVAMPGKQIIVADTMGRSHEAFRVFVDVPSDMALLGIDPNVDIAPAPLECRTPRLDERVSLSGHPFEYGFFKSTGRIASPPRLQDGFTAPMVLVDKSVGVGMSGGPVRDSSGGVVAVIVAQATTGQGVPLGIALVSPVAPACEFLAGVPQFGGR